MSDKFASSSLTPVGETAYASLYKEYYRKLYNYGRKFTPDTDVLQDSIQEVFLDFWLKQEKMRTAENLPAYFFSSFRYTLLKNLKRLSKKAGNESVPDELEFFH